jgi:FKBP-type peptidyl-prolyl cis-trans isomerase (trigger factor)
MANYKITQEEKLEKSQIKLTVELSDETVAHYEEKALSDIGKDVKMDGFREGKVPTDMLKEKVGELAIKEQATRYAIQDVLFPIIQEKDLKPITEPAITISKIAVGEPAEFVVVLTLVPEVTLADYKKIATQVKNEKAEDVTDEELEGHIQRIRTNHTQNERQLHDHKEGEDCKECKDKPELPELNDEFVQKLGDFKDVEDFKVKLRTSMGEEKEVQVRHKRREAIISEVIEKSEIELPEVLVEQELGAMLAQLEQDISRMGIQKLEDYYTAINKTAEEIKAEWRPDAEKRAKMNSILPAIAKEENIVPDEELVTKQITEIKETHLKGQEVDEFKLKVYVEGVMVNEAVLKHLEELK